MKPKNFPERINERRKVALSHLKSESDEGKTLINLIRPSRRHERSKKAALDINGVPCRYRKPRGIKP